MEFLQIWKEKFLLWFADVPGYIKAIAGYGLLIGFINAVYLYIMVLTPIGQIPYVGYTKLLFIAVDIYFLVKVLKLSRLAEKKYVDQVIVGTVMFGVASLVFGGAVNLLTQVVRPNLLAEQRESVMRVIKEKQDIKEEDKQKVREQYERQLQQPQFTLDQITGMTTNGLLYSVVTAIFIRHKENKVKEKSTDTSR